MRLIEFRGKCLDTGDFVYGDLTYGILNTVISYPINVRPCTSEPAGCTDIIYNAIDHKTVGQFTGLKDKNGVKIFEGDILYCSDRNYSLVRHISGAYELHEVGTDKMFFLYKHLDKVSVIGNIHEDKK